MVVTSNLTVSIETTILLTKTSKEPCKYDRSRFRLIVNRSLPSVQKILEYTKEHMSRLKI